jgi:solute carrier family 12 (sodium/potassium/chloride transporter), member 2
MNKDTPQIKRKTFGTFAGVFTPTTLTILGVIMFIREPWVVGNAGVLGALTIVIISVSITLTTALSLSSITTNVRIGAGGAFSLISQSLGLEIGGAIGIPFYFAQAIAVTMYIFGFREGLQTLLPRVAPILLDLGIFALVIIIVFISTGFAFKIQYVILGLIILSLFSIYGALFVRPLQNGLDWVQRHSAQGNIAHGGYSFWSVFAVFFPAVTGVMAGANMSGDLTNPRRSIPVGTISSVIITAVIYISLVFVAALIADPKELVQDYNVFLDKSLYKPVVVAGLLGASLSSALGSFVGAPRILQALGEKNILPKSNQLKKLSSKGEPVNAMKITALIVLAGISLRNLNTIAPLITMFFMITYAMVNVVALVEQSLGLPSFRPGLKIPLIVPALGAFGSIVIMFVINPIVAMFSLILILLFYFYLVKKNIKSEAGDSRSGLFTALAEWATKKTSDLSPEKEVRSWRPDLLIPVTMPKDIRSSYKLIHSVVYPKGSVKLLVLKNPNPSDQKNMETFLNNVVAKFRESGLPVSYTVIDNTDFNVTLNVSMQSLHAAFFKPNVVFLSIDPSVPHLQNNDRLLADAKINNYGMIIYIPYATSSLAIEKSIHLWIINLPPDWKQSFNAGNNDLSTLVALLVCRNWKGTITVHILRDVSSLQISEDDLEDLRAIIRFPAHTFMDIKTGDLLENVKMIRSADVNILNIADGMSVQDMIRIVNESRISAIFCADSTLENVMV